MSKCPICEDEMLRDESLSKIIRCNKCGLELERHEYFRHGTDNKIEEIELFTRVKHWWQFWK